jgi:hypothetical protein
LKYAKHHHPIEIKTGSFWGQNRPLKADGSYMVIRIKTEGMLLMDIFKSLLRGY